MIKLFCQELVKCGSVLAGMLLTAYVALWTGELVQRLNPELEDLTYTVYFSVVVVIAVVYHSWNVAYHKSKNQHNNDKDI